MTFMIESPVIVGTLLVLLVQQTALAIFLLWRLRALDADHAELCEEADLQGDALREALAEIDRHRRPRRPGR
jgi:hypothetical protein